MYTIIVLLCIGFLAHDICADTTHLTPSKDNTLFEDAHGIFSNGAGAYLFAGTTHSGPLRRTLLAFDLSSISTDATITSVALTMQMTRTSTSNAHAVSLHNLQGDWGEGASDAVGEEGVGARTEPGDATWTDAIADQAAWASPGGDFNPEASASLSISDLGIYIWTSTPQLVADVQGWVQDPVTNFGWILIGNESANGTAKRFNSSENSVNRPVLTVKYTPAAGASPERTGSASLGAVKDNSLYEDAAGALSNGSGEFLFVGRTGQPKNRRALLAFEFSSVPPTAIITSAALTMHLSRTSPGGTQSIAVRKMRSDWGEGLSDAGNPEGLGTTALSGDATWLHAFFDTTPWTTPGGDFSETTSASLDIANPGSYTWTSTTQLIADVQDWIQTPPTNLGWILLGNESDSRTAKRFDSRENISGSNRPKLALTYTFPNSAPTLAAPIAVQRLIAGQEPVTLDLSDVFSDGNGDALSYAATSADSSVAEVSVATGALSIVPLTPGTTTIALIADDGQGGQFIAPFDLAVVASNTAPILVADLPDLTLFDNMPEAEIDLANVFSDPDGDALSYTAASADTAIASIALDGSSLHILARAYQSTTITLMATDDRGESAATTFVVEGRLTGDFNGDEDVTFGDFFIFADNFGQRDFDPATDLDADGDVDFGDFFIFADNFGKTSTGANSFGDKVVDLIIPN